MTNVSDFLSTLLRVAPELIPMYEEHLTDHGEALPHVFMGEVSQYVIRSFESAFEPPGEPHDEVLQNILTAIENALRDGSDETRDVISASFVENIAQAAKAHPGVRSRLGNSLQRELRLVLRAWGEE